MDEEAFDSLGDSDLDGSPGSSPFRAEAMRDGLPVSARGFSQVLWQSAELTVAKALLDPFVLALAQGTLPRSAFQAYIVEDNFFLRSFARGYEAAIASCRAVQPPALATAMQRKLEELLAGVKEELSLHEGYARGWGVDLSQHPVPSPSTRKYLEFLESITSRQPREGVASIMSAMVPCLRLYAYLGCSIARALPYLDHNYLEWIHNYASPPYLQLPATAESILDELAETEPPEKLIRQYHKAMSLEVDFFASQPYTAPLRTINLLVVDFDDTCTTEDTTSRVSNAAIAAAMQKQSDEQAVAEARKAGEEQMQWLVQNYLERRSALLDEILPEIDEEAEEFDMGWLGDFLDRLSDFDREMNSVVVESGFLAGIRRGALAEVGQKITMREGCLALLRRAVDAGIPVAVVSVNWSAEMVQAALSQQGLPVVVAAGGGGTAAGVEGCMPPPGALMVYANELEYFGDVSTGSLKRRCECAADKGRVFDDLLLGAAADGHSDPDGVSVYIGDSMTDIPALISADVGLVMGSNALVRQVAMVAGVPIRPLITYPVDPGGDYHPEGIEAGAPVLFEAASWAEVDAFLFGRQFKQLPPRTPSLREQFSGSTSWRLTPGAPPRVLTIAGSDCSGGAGIQADMKTCMACGAYASTAVTAITAQNTRGVHGVHVPPPDILRQQIKAVLTDVGADAVKTGMLPSVESVEIVADELSSLGSPPPLVVDPVLIATSGDPLAGQGVAQALVTRLFPLATVVTPNIQEASMLLGDRPIVDLEGMKAAAQDLHAFGPQWVLLKGGHLRSLPQEQRLQEEPSKEVDREMGSTCSKAIDVLFDGRNIMELEAPYIQTTNAHGTGCSLASAIAAELAKGASVPDAVRTAKHYVWRLLERSVGLPFGEGDQKPMNHGYKIADWRAEIEAGAAIAQEVAAATAAALGDELSPQNTSSSGLPTPVNVPRRIANPVDVRLYAVTDTELIKKSGRTLSEAVMLCADGGATVVQLREKGCDGGEYRERAMLAAAACRSAGIPLIVNDRVDVAMAVQADGVHVGQGDLPAAAVRRLIGPDMILGVSVKTVQQALAAEAAGADYLGAGACFTTGTKDSSVIGVDGLRDICEAVNIPVVAIGGIGPSNAGEVLASGCDGVAAVSAIFGAKNVVDAARELRMIVDGVIKSRDENKSDV